MTTDFAEIAGDWSPAPLEETRTVTADHMSAFLRLLDEPDDATGAGVLPPLWHWFAFTPRLSQADLGDDGHPTAGQFLPPIPHRRRMLGGGSVEIERPLRLETSLTRLTRLENAEHKRGRSGDMLIVSLRHEYHDADGPAVVEREVAIYRSQSPGASRGLAKTNAGSDAADLATATLALPTSASLLFGFSALTGNFHRIHYDAPYAVDIERYEGLIVHGPLLALLMLEVPRRSGRPVGGFEFRFHSPLVVGDTATVTHGAADAKNSLDLRVVSGSSGVLCASGRSW